MVKVAVFEGPADAAGMVFRAVAVRNQEMGLGRTPGEALDALASQLSADAGDTLIMVRNLLPDRSFNAEQQQRLEQLMGQWRSARDQGRSLAVEEQTELERLIDAELDATAKRVMALDLKMARLEHLIDAKLDATAKRAKALGQAK